MNKTIKNIVNNPYIGFTLIIKEIIEIAHGIINNLKLNQIMDWNLMMNLAVDLFIAIVIYNLLKQYKTKVTSDQLQKEMNSTREQLQKEIVKMQVISKLRDIYFKQSIRFLFRICRNLSGDCLSPPNNRTGF